MLRRPRRGYILVAVMAVVAILMVLMAALQYQRMAQRSSTILLEAQYLADRSVDSLTGALESSLEQDVPSGMSAITLVEDDLVSESLGPDPRAFLDRNSIVVDADIYSRAGQNYGAWIFSHTERKGVGNKEDAQKKEDLNGRERLLPPQAVVVDGHPTSKNPNLNVFRRSRYRSTLVAGFPYAAFAGGDNGSVELEKLATWKSPALGQLDQDTENPLDYASGLAPYVGAGDRVKVDDFKYGEAYSKKGNVSVKGGAVAFSGYLPYETWGQQKYSELLQTSLDGAFSALSSRCTDKTGVIFGMLSLPDTMALIINGTTPQNFLTYEAASRWWFFMLPSIKTVGVALDFRLHVPMPADTQLLADAGAAAAPRAAQIVVLNEDIKKLQDGLLPENSPDRSKWDENTAGKVPELDWPAKEYLALEGQLNTLKSELSTLQDEKDDLQDDRDRLQDKIDGEKAKDSPNNSLITSWQNQIKTIDGRITSVNGRISAKQDAIDAKQKEVDAKKKEVEDKDKEVQRDKDSIDRKKNEIESLAEHIEELANDWLEGDPRGPDQMTEWVMSYMSFGGGKPDTSKQADKEPSKDTKQTKSNEKDTTKLISKKGMMLYSYAGLIIRLLAQVVDIIENAVSTFPMLTIKINLGFTSFKIKIPDFPKIPSWLKGVGQSMVEGFKNLVVYEVALVFLDGLPLKKISGNHFDIVDTFNVPPGRTFKLQGDMTIDGDLWLQQGSTMEVTGDLKLKDPGWGDMMQPHGRIYLEEGATLLVGGDLKAAGDKFLGSVVACGPMKLNIGISSAIICKGSVDLPHGTGGGITAQELMGWLRGKKGRNVVRTLMEDWAPNLSKAPKFLGPFYTRMPYFGKHPTILRYVLPFGPLYPTFEPIDQNINVNIFRALTQIFGIHLNLVLGENFVTSTTWWAWGGEQAAVFPKSAGKAMETLLDPVVDTILSAIDWAEKMDVDDVLGDLINSGKDLINNPQSLILSTIVPAALQALNPDPTGLSNELVDKALEEILGDNSPGAKSESVTDSLGLTFKAPGGKDFNLFKPMKVALTHVQDAVNGLTSSSGFSISENQERESAHVLLVECPGVLVYGQSSVQVGPDPWSSSPSARAVGCFISDGNVTINTLYTIGSMVSFNGNIKARKLYYTPYFTRASLYKPKKLKTGGTNITANADLWENAVNLKYGSAIDTQEAVDIPSSQVFYPASRGWGP